MIWWLFVDQINDSSRIVSVVEEEKRHMSFVRQGERKMEEKKENCSSYHFSWINMYVFDLGYIDSMFLEEACYLVLYYLVELETQKWRSESTLVIQENHRLEQFRSRKTSFGSSPIAIVSTKDYA